MDKEMPLSSPVIDVALAGESRAFAGRNRHLSVSGRLLKVARLTEEWYEDIDDPEAVAAQLKKFGPHADIFTFWQRLPHSEPRYPYHRETDTIAVLPITTYDHWLKSQVNNKTRNLILKAKKKGVVVRKSEFDDAFVRGMVAIFNETPIRQDRPFWHYGKGAETIKKGFSRYLFREEMFGAYIDDELVGFIMLADAGRFAMLGQIISMVRYRDRSPNNALIAKAVEVCAERGIPALVYAMWPRGPLREFKRHNGFGPVELPRYYMPLTRKGALAIKFGLHREITERLPENVVMYFRNLRSKFYAYKYKQALALKASPAAVARAGSESPHSEVSSHRQGQHGTRKSPRD